MVSLAQLLPLLFPQSDLDSVLAELTALSLENEADVIFHPFLSSSLEFLRQPLIDFASSGGVPASEVRSGSTFVSTGIAEVDTTLGHGWRMGDVVQLCGQSSLVSQTTLSFVLRFLIQNGDNRVAWLDATGNFSAQSAYSILRRLQPAIAQEEAEEILERLEVTSGVSSIPTALQRMDAADQDSSQFPLRMLVVDSLFTLCKLSSASPQGHAHMVAFLKRLKAFANATTPKIVLALNATVQNAAPQANNHGNASYPLSSFKSCTVRPGLGITMTYLIDVVLWITYAHDVFAGERSNNKDLLLEVWQSNRSPAPAWTRCTI